MHVVILNSSPSEGRRHNPCFLDGAFQKWIIKNKKVNKLHYIPYEKFYEALKDPLKLIADVLDTRKPDNIKLISMVVRPPAIQHRN